MVITKDNTFANALTNYINHKNLWGYKILVKTLDEIYTTYTTGIDNADKMRQCVIDAYLNDGISYLMLFGDSHPNGGSSHNVIPYRKMYVDAGGTVDNLPSDVYFACLDGTWYNPATNKWGEVGFEDLGHEISVGRICADNPNEIATFVTKLIKYQETPVVADIKKALMVGEELNDNPLTYGGDCKDQIATGGTFNGYTTVGFPPTSDFVINRLYDKNGYWGKSQLINYFKNGIHLVNHLGHSGTDYNMKLGNGDVNNNNFPNTGVDRGLAIVYSQGCYNGAFDNDGGNTDCINEMFHKINGGVVANIGNSRFGWYNPGGTNGPSQRFDRYFFDGIFGQHIYTIGDANSYSKDVISALVQNNTHLRWCSYELTLLGDPSMDIWTDVPTDFDPEYVKVMKGNDTEIGVSTGIPYARVAVLQNNQLLSRGVCDEEGDAMLIFDEPFDPATVLLSVSAHNKKRYQQTGITFTDAPPIENLTADVDGIKVDLEWEEPNLSKHEPPIGYAVYRDGVKIGTTDVLTYQDMAPTPNTTFDYCVKALYTGYSSAPVCEPATTGMYCVVVTQVKATVKQKRITIYWNEPDYLPEKYKLFRDGVFVKETKNTLVYDDVPKENTEYEFCVVAQYEDCDSEPACVTAKSGVVCGAIDKITPTVDVLSIHIAWDHLSPNELVQYIVTRDGEVVQESVEASFDDVVPEEDTEYTYCITAEFDKCTSDEKCITVKSGTMVGITENGQTAGITVYPNPNRGELTIEMCDMRYEICDIQIFDVMGRVVATVGARHALPLQWDGTLNIAHLPNGIYFIRIQTENDVITQKIIKK